MSKLYKLSIGENISSHSARYTFVNLLLEKNTNIYLISKALGHSNLGITERYIKRNFGAEKLNISETLQVPSYVPTNRRYLEEKLFDGLMIASITGF